MPSARESITPHIVVCGAGVIGAAIAYYLSERGARVTIVEEGEVAGAASGKAGGFLASDWCDGTPLAQLARTSFSMHERLARRYGARYDYRRLKTYSVGSSVSLTSDLPEARWLSRPFRVNGLLGDERTTAQVDPRKFTQTLIDAASRNGANRVQARVERIRSTGGRVDRVRVNATELDCDAVVIAMGPWSGITSLGLPVPTVYGLKGHSVTITPKSELPAQALFMEDVMLGGTLSAPELLTRPDGTVYLSGISEQVPLPSRARDVAPREDAGELLSDLALSLSSSFKPADINPPAACFRPVYPDGLPRMGRIPGIRGAYLASGHSCWGILNAPASGAAMAELILTGTSETVDLTPFDPGRST